MFYDEAVLAVKAGRGGDGVVSWRRESMTPMGGPDGGNGGRGGDVILVGSRHLNTLMSFQHKRRWFAPDGAAGARKNMTGKSGKPLYVPVPLGTVVYDAGTEDVLGEVTVHEAQLIIAKGGRGGRGNTTFATSTNQAPNHAENGTLGEARSIRLVLKLIADIGIVGLPNAGKSTLLAALTAAQPKIANYPFTTLQPNLGVAEVAADRAVVLADIPGLIEGASDGKGLGHEFLRHIERTRVLIHLIDGLSDDPRRDFDVINAELAAFGHGLADKPQVVALTKMDLPDAEASFELFASSIAPTPAEGGPVGVMAISSAIRKNVRELLIAAVRVLDALPPLDETPVIPTLVAGEGEKDEGFEITQEGGGYRISSRYLEQRAQITRWDLDESIQRFQRSLERSGAGPALEKMGVAKGDTVYIGEYELEWGD